MQETSYAMKKCQMDAEQLLRNLGVTGNLKGFRYAAYMIELVEQDPTAATLVTKYLYYAIRAQLRRCRPPEWG